MAFNLSKQIDVRDTCSNIDILYGPYNSIEHANSVITKPRRALGRTVGIIEGGSVEEYWYKSGIDDQDLIKKRADEAPTLKYTEDFPSGVTIKKDLGELLTIKVNFSSSAYGQCTVTITKNGALFKTVKANKGVITLDLGVQNEEGTFTYNVTAIDSLTIPADQELTFKVVVGGVSIVTDFQDTIDKGLNTESNISIIYSASVADTSKTIKVYGEVLREGSIVAEHSYQGSGSTPSKINNAKWDIGALGTPGNYRVNMYSYTGDSKDDNSGDNVTKSISYSFSLLEPNDFIMSSDITEKVTDSNTAVSIPFRIYSGGNPVLQAKGNLYNAEYDIQTQSWKPIGDPIPNYVLDRSVTSNVINYWSLGKVDAGNYIIRLFALTTGQEEAPSGKNEVDIYLKVEQYTRQYDIIRDGLLAEFTADSKSNNNDEDTKGVWENEVIGSDIRFELHDLNYNTNGWKHVDESKPDTEAGGEMMLRFSGDSYGVLKQGDSNYNPMSLLSSNVNNGITCEILYRTKCIGELNNKVITGHKNILDDTAGFSASYDKLTLGSDATVIKYDVAENEWIHATFVIDKTIHTDVTDVQDYAPEKLLTVYVNGSMCAASILTELTFKNYGPVLLNAAVNNISNEVEFFGQCDIKAIRFYGRPLMASEVVNNYIASIYDEDEQSEVVGRNGDVLPIVKFVNINATHPQYPLPEGVELIDFATLNQMENKSDQKKKYVCCSTFYQENSNSEVIEWPRTIVQTQGTSTLKFPVKNYKVKIYDPTSDEYSRKWTKCEDYVNVFAEKDWDNEYQFTLKCDYMEAAHLNNTPSCIFYNEMIDTLVEKDIIKDGWNEDRTVYTAANDERTPSRRDEHFDAIKGFPCLVYYYESEEDYYNNNGTYVGTYMFNLDKSADSLGFESPAKLDTDGETIIQTEDFRNGGYVDHMCQSFEGVANKSDSAGCFFSYEAWQESFYNTYCEAAFKIYKDEGNTDITSLDDFIQYYSIEYPDVKYRTGNTKPVDFDDGGLLYTKDRYISEASPYEDEYAYFAADYESRYDWGDLEEGGEEFWGNSEWGLKRMIDWVSDRSQDLTLFKQEFNQYFNFKYCALYYLQMILFGQVDNAGKNSMWDTWDGIIWQPRPYDCDTMAGLDNTGFEKINPDAELIRSLSPLKNFNNTPGTAKYHENVAVDANSRYEAYNTRTSRFWISFGKAFATELNALYKTLRDLDIYSIDNIVDKFTANTSKIIGENYYNRDMTTKFYKLADIGTFISRMHGNRVQKFKSWMSNRIAFCDSLFDYSSVEKSLNNSISMRADAVGADNSTVSINVGVKVYSPQYVRFDVGSSQDAIIEAYCSPDARYLDPISGEEKEGTLFTIPLTAGNKEMSITGGNNIREFVNLGALRPSSLIFNNATRLNNLDLSNSTKLTALSLSKNIYLQYLNCIGATKLGSDYSGAQLDLSNCANLKEVLLDRTKLTSVTFPKGGALKKVSIANTTITGIELDSLYFLTDINVDNCENIISYKIKNCPKLQSIKADYLPLNTVKIESCSNLEDISLKGNTAINEFSIYLCPKIKTLNLQNNRSAAVNTLDLTSLYSIEDLDIGGSIVTKIKFPLHTSPSSDDYWGNNFKSLNMSGSNLKYIQYGETSVDAVDMKQLTGLTSLSFSNCSKIEKIVNLDYSGSCNKLFYSCTSLKSIEGKLTCNGSAANMCDYCYALNDIDKLELNFSRCSSLNYAFSRCKRLKYTSIKKVLDSCGTSLTDIGGLCYLKNEWAKYENEPELSELPAYFFGNCKNVTNAGSVLYGSSLTKMLINAFTDSSGHPGLKECTYLNIAFANNHELEGIPVNIITYLPKAVSLKGLFLGDNNAEITLPSSFFANGGNISDICGMFYNCSKATINMDNMSELLEPLTELTNAALLFKGCTKCTGTIPEGFFANNRKLTDISGCFRETPISKLPQASLFKNSTYTGDITTLKNISGLFENCTSLNDNARSNLFEGASEVTTAGTVGYRTPTGDNLTLNGVFAGCNKIVLFGSDLFNNMPKLRNLSNFFKGCTSLTSLIGTSFSGDILNTHQNLTNVSGLFSGCTTLSISVVPNLFASSKNTITNVSGLFSNCKGISSFDINLFADMPSLTDASDVFNGCSNLSIYMTDSGDMFKGCSRLQNTARAFSGCEEITGGIPVELFDSCRSSIQNVSEMFKGCTGLNESIYVGNEDVQDSGSSEYKLGLLANCLKLTSTKGMFRGCINISGEIPWDLFYTDNVEKIYTQLTDVSEMFYNVKFNEPTLYDNENYLIHPEFFSKLQSVTTMKSMFQISWDNAYNWSESYSIHPNAFDSQYFLTDISYMFSRCDGLAGNIDSNWFKNSITKIEDARAAFAATNVTSVGDTFLRPSSTTPNNKLKYVAKMFWRCSELTNLPQCNNVTIFTRIDYNEPTKGYTSFCYGCDSNITSSFGDEWKKSTELE